MNTEGISIGYGAVKPPLCSEHLKPEILTEETRKERLAKILDRMQQSRLDVILVYADREHGANFAYLTGFEPRFEEALLVLHQDATAYLLLGNENMKMCSHSTLPATAIHVPHFSLPNQPMDTEKTFLELLCDSGIGPDMTVGVAGWKLFTGRQEDNRTLFDIPYFIVDALQKIVSPDRLEPAAHLFLAPEHGARTTVNANEIAHYEFGAALASDCILRTMDRIEPGKTEMEIADGLAAFGQPGTVTTICATGDRFDYGIVFPRNKKICLGDKFSMTMGLRGGLTSRAAYVAADASDLPEQVRDYLEKLVIPYYQAAVSWYEMIGIGVTGGELYKKVEAVLPKEQFHWSLNPGHFTSDEEWMSSPVYPKSGVPLQSGMMLQMDIIPGIAGYGGVSAEDGIVLADEALRRQLESEYPELWKRFVRRREYMMGELGICLKPEVLPMSDAAGYLRPYLLNHGAALKKEKTYAKDGNKNN